MSRCICIMGESGSGKTTSMRNLDPATTFYVDCDKKGLSWRGWKQQYNAENKNYMRTDDQNRVLACLRALHESADYKHIKTVVIDTINGIMVADEMRRSKERGYDKWLDLAVAIYDILDISLVLREDLTIICVAHSQTERDDAGFMFTRIKTSGKKLDKITLESKFSTVLLAKVIDGKYVLETRADRSTAKAPMGMFAEAQIENDIALVLKAMEEY